MPCTAAGLDRAGALPVVSQRWSLSPRAASSLMKRGLIKCPVSRAHGQDDEYAQTLITLEAKCGVEIIIHSPLTTQSPHAQLEENKTKSVPKGRIEG